MQKYFLKKYSVHVDVFNKYSTYKQCRRQTNSLVWLYYLGVLILQGKDKKKPYYQLLYFNFSVGCSIVTIIIIIIQMLQRL